MVCGFRALLDFVTPEIAKYWGYMGIVYQPQSLELYIFSFVLLLIPIIFLYRKPLTVSTYGYQILYITTYIPMTSQFATNSRFTLSAAIAGCSCFFLLGLITHLPLFTKKTEPTYFSHKRLIAVVSFIACIVYPALVIRQGLPTTFPNPFDGAKLYAYRANVEMGTMLEYLYGWQTLVTNIMLIGFGVLKKNKWAIGSGLLLQVLNYQFTGLKFVLFGTLIYLALAIGVKQFKNKFPYFLIFLFSASIIFAEIVDNRFDLAPLAHTFITRRTFIVPAQLYFEWHDYFSHHSYDYFAQSFPFKYFFKSQYTYRLAEEIGIHYYNITKPPHANSNFLADGYANLGLVGMLLITFLLGLYLKIAEFYAQNKPLVLTLAPITLPIINFGSTSFLTNLMTGGALFGLLCIILLPHSSLSEPND